MGFLKQFSKRFFHSRPTVQQLPTGSVTVDRNGQVVTYTVSSAYPKAMLREIGLEVLSLFREARLAQMPLAEISIHSPASTSPPANCAAGPSFFCSHKAPFRRRQLPHAYDRQRTQPTGHAN